MLGGGLSPGPWTGCAHSGPHRPGSLLSLWGQGWRRAMSLLLGVREAKAPLDSCKELGLPGSAAPKLTACCLEGRDWLGGGGVVEERGWDF